MDTARTTIGNAPAGARSAPQACAEGAAGAATPVRWGLAGACLLLALGAAGCTGGHGGKATWRPAPPASAPASADPKTAARTEALAAYRGMWRAYMTATRTADANDPDLARYAAGEALRVVRSGLRWMRKHGLRGRGEVKLAPTVNRLKPVDAPKVASIGDCVDTSDTRMYRVDGGRYPDTPGGKRALQAAVKHVGGGTWKVTGFGLREVGTCD